MFGSDRDIAKALREYGPLIEGARSPHSSLSTYRVEKPWGYEVWLTINKYFALKLIHMNAGTRCSFQYHKKKREANIIIEGSADVLVENMSTGVVERRTLGVGEGWTIEPLQAHRVIAEVAYTAVEVSTAHLSDVVRLHDDSGRCDGEVGGEHGKL